MTRKPPFKYDYLPPADLLLLRWQRLAGFARLGQLYQAGALPRCILSEQRRMLRRVGLFRCAEHELLLARQSFWFRLFEADANKGWPRAWLVRMAALELAPRH